MIANLQKAIWDKEVVTIGGGQFEGEELRLLLRHLQLGQALDRVAGELPEGFEVIVELERFAGSVTLIDPDGNEHDCSEDSGETFAGHIERALATARSLP